MKKNELFLLDTFIDNNKLLLCLVNNEASKSFLYFNYTPTLYVKSSYKFIKNLSKFFKISFYSTEMGEIYTGKKVKVYGIKMDIKNFWNVKAYLLNQENIGVYNSDLSPLLQFYFEHNLFPFAKVEVTHNNNHIISIKSLDNPMDINYKLPPLNILGIFPVCKGNPKYSQWTGIDITMPNGEKLFFEKFDTEEFFISIGNIFKEYDPDMVITLSGDPVIIPLIKFGAQKYNIDIPLSRPTDNLKIVSKKSYSFFSYGKVVFKDSISYLKGRIHIDINNSFFVKNSGIDGLIEVARLTSLPLQEAARISPGSSISTMELKTAYKNNYLIPSHKAFPERFKRAIDFIKVDKGGLFFLPPVGIFKNVAEVDFFSMYPSIIEKFNISVETLNCKCCQHISEKLKIPGTNYYFCQKKQGIIPETISPLLKKRKLYKNFKASEVFKNRQNAIKWMLVTCFGYLGYKNAKFGCVEAHEATTAAGRDILLKAKEIAENNGFKIIYAVTDSLYIYKKNATREEYTNIVKEISTKTGFILNIEGIYQFIKFLPSAENKNKQVMNKFFGIFDNGKIKVRGLMLRKRDTPIFIKNFQQKLLKIFPDYKRANKILKEYLLMLQNGEVNIDELVIKKRVSKPISSYKNKNLNIIAASSLTNIQPGESVEYVITDNRSKVSEERVKIRQIADSYDIEYYREMLIKAYNEIMGN